MIDTQEKINFFIENQFSEYFRREGENLVRFIELYYEWMDEVSNVNGKIRNLTKYNDIDQLDEEFVKFLKNEFMSNFPSHMQVDEKFLLKHIVDFYRSKGSEKSFRLLFRILFNTEINLYYPAVDVFRTSESTWTVEKSLHLLTNRPVDELNTRNAVKGMSSGAKARVDHYSEIVKDGVLTKELFLNNIQGDFLKNETIIDLSNGEILGTVFSEGLVVYPGKFLTTDGFLSEDKFLHDNDYYQDFSYEIQSSRSAHTYKDVVEKTVHPAGTKMFSKVVQSFEDLNSYITSSDEIVLTLPEVDIVTSSIDTNLIETKKVNPSIDSNYIEDEEFYFRLWAENGFLSEEPIDVLPGEFYTVTFDAKSGSSEYITIYQDGWNEVFSASFNLNTHNIVEHNEVFYDVLDNEDGSYRYSVTFVVPDGATIFNPKIVPYLLSIYEQTYYILGDTTPTVVFDFNNERYFNNGIVTLSDILSISHNVKFIENDFGYLESTGTTDLLTKVFDNKYAFIENSSYNYIKNNSNYGASNIPQYWTATNFGDVTLSYLGTGTERGYPYISLRLFGLSTSSGAVKLEFDLDDFSTVAESYCFSTFISSSNDMSVKMKILSNGTMIEENVFTPKKYLEREKVIGTPANGTTLRAIIEFDIAATTTYDNTIKIALPQFEKNSDFSSVVKTTNGAIQRSTDSYNLLNNVSDVFNSDYTIYMKLRKQDGVKISGVSKELINISGNNISFAYDGGTLIQSNNDEILNVMRSENSTQIVCKVNNNAATLQSQISSISDTIDKLSPDCYSDIEKIVIWPVKVSSSLMNTWFSDRGI